MNNNPFEVAKQAQKPASLSNTMQLHYRQNKALVSVVLDSFICV